MRKTPQFLAFLFILITIGRVAAFIEFGLHVGWTAKIFAVALAVGVYVTAYFLRYKETRIPAGIGLAFFTIMDLWFNEFELIRVLSAVSMVAPESNFMNWDAEKLHFALQVSALAFGAFPTIAAGVLGWLQAGADRVATLKTRRINLPFAVAFAAKIQSWIPETTDTVKITRPGGNQGAESAVIDGTEISAPQLPSRSSRWERLTENDKADIAANSVFWIIQKYGFSGKGAPRKARMWKQWVREGK